MAILVKPVQRINPLDKEAPKKWYVTQVTTAQADETEVAMELADETTLNPSEAQIAAALKEEGQPSASFVRSCFAGCWEARA